jgi:hypothetical protein
VTPHNRRRGEAGSSHYGVRSELTGVTGG